MEVVLPLLVLAGLAGAGVVLLRAGLRRQRRVAAWPRVEGRVLGTDAGLPGGVGRVRYPTVGFRTRDGREVRARSAVGDSVTDWAPGRPVVVRYDPQDPQRVAVEGANEGGLLVLLGTVLAAVGGAGLAVLLLGQLL